MVGPASTLRRAAFCALIAAAPAWGQAGKTGMSFLKLGVGARTAGMGEAGSALAADPTALWYNPAALTLSRAPQIMFMHTSWIEDTKTDYLGARTAAGDLALGFGVNQTSVSDIEIRKTPGPPEGVFTARNASIGAGAAYRVDPALSIGVSGSFLYEKILVNDATGVAFGAGALYTTPWDVMLGISIENAGSMSELASASTRLPTAVRVGGSYRAAVSPVSGSVTLAGEFVSFTGESIRHLHVGAELEAEGMFAVRGGFLTGYEARSITAGFGIRRGSLSLDYAFAPFTLDLGSAHTIALGFSFE